jgi:hypothetical protein
MRLKLKFAEPLSNLAFNPNLRRYIMDEAQRTLATMAGAYTRALLGST